MANAKAQSAKVEIGTGLKMAIPTGYFGKIEGRSGLALKGLTPLAGIIDADYRGEIKVIMRNCAEQGYRVQKGNRIAQLCILKCPNVLFKESSQLGTTERGCHGFGSTGC